MGRNLILAIDIGSSSIRAALFDERGLQVPRSLVRLARSFETTADGGYELNPNQEFIRVVSIVDSVLAKNRVRKGNVEFLVLCSYWHSLVGVDAGGNPTTPIFGWADTRSRAYSDVLKKRFDAAAVHGRTGAHFHSSYWPAKLLWLRREFPEVWARTARWMSFSDYLAFKLTGKAATSVSMASGTGIFDQRKCDWDTELIKYLKIRRARLPAIAASDSASFRLLPAFARRWPRLKMGRLFPAIGDGAADNIGAGCVSNDRAALMVGTSAAIRVAYVGEPPAKIPDGLWCYRIDRRRVVIGGALSDGGNLYRFLKNILKVPNDADDEMRRRGADAHGLTFMPFVFGERSTGYNESATGSIQGLTAAHDGVDIMQAAMESVAYRLAEILNRLETIVNVKGIIASGGALRDSRVWPQIIADVLGRDLVVAPTAESSMRGAVLLALESIGKIENVGEPKSERLAFHPECHAIYRKALDRHRKVYNSLTQT